MKRSLIVSFLLLFFASYGFAQSADKVSEIIKTDRVTYGQIAYLSAISLGIAVDDTPYEQAFSMLQTNSTIKDNVLVNDIVPLSHLAFIMMRTWKIKPCLMYALFPSPHYALRSMKANGIINSSYDPAKVSSGHEALTIFTKCMDKYEPYTEPEFRELRVYK